MAGDGSNVSATSGAATRILVPMPPTLANSSQDPSQPVSSTLDALDDDFKAQLLAHFRDEMAGHFPFLAQGPFLTEGDGHTAAHVAECIEKAPFAFAAVCMCALHRHPTLQKRASQEMLASIATAMLLQGRKSLDLLYALIITEACTSRNAFFIAVLTAHRVSIPRYS
jgi:hypothetical protein